jgi:hypothetical protein
MSFANNKTRHTIETNKPMLAAITFGMSIAENISVNGVKVPMALSLSFLTLLLQWDFFGSIRTPPNRSDGTNCTEKKRGKTQVNFQLYQQN